MAFRGVIRRVFTAATVAAALHCAPIAADAATLGADVANIATISYHSGALPVSVVTPPAIFTIEAKRTPSTIEFFRYAPNAPDADLVNLHGSDYLASGAFSPIGPLVSVSGAAIDTAAPVPVVPSTSYYSGEAVIVKVTDAGQNGDPAVVETLAATIRTANGDFVTLRLYENGPNSGEFFAYIPSASGNAAINDPILTIAKGQDLTARYQDPFDATEISTDVAAVDPYGRLFDSLTGDLVDGAQVTIIDNATGQPAQVFGIDGASAYPSTIFTGQAVTDAGGRTHVAGPGEFQFPILLPGSYRLAIRPPDGYTAPSSAPTASFARLSNAPFTIVGASYGGDLNLSSTGDASFDVPLDPQTDIVVFKSAGVETAAIGDFIRYQISVENRGETAAPIAIADQLPRGLRYQSGSARRDGVQIADPTISAAGDRLQFNLGTAAPGQTIDLTYVAEVGPGVGLGDAINTATAVGPAGQALSNRAEAAVFIRDDFLRNNFTIVGRIVVDACDVENDEIVYRRAGKGVQGVRLYMETGATVVSDENGLYHFEDVKPGAHVVQVDEASLPRNYELAQCVENTRYAGRAFSQFVDARGGSMWRADFYLRKTATDAGETKAKEEIVSASNEHALFDKAWLNGQSADIAWAYPSEEITPSSASVNIGLKHGAQLRATLYVNGHEVSPANYAGRDVNLIRTVALSRWRGIDLLSGANHFEAVLKDEQGAEVTRISRVIHFVNTVERATYAPEQSVLFADGVTRPVIAVRLTDGAGRPVHAGRLVEITIDPPYRGADKRNQHEIAPLTDPLSARATASVGEQGVALIELEPTVETGVARVEVTLDDGSRKEIMAYLKPALRDWIVVGLAEASGGFEKTDRGSGASPSELIGDGRIAGFAKGAVKGGWLVTLAGDSKRRRGEQDAELFDAVNPDDRYAVFGDRSNQEFEAQSRYPVYAKVEKDAFQTMLGDYDTKMTESKLGRYARRLSGVQSHYEGRRFSFNGFAAETNQAFVKDELAADGTSGPFRMTNAPMVRNSETLMIETRDRFRPDVVVATTPLERYADYDIDFHTGEIILRLPVPAADAAYNPNVIVVDYETSSPVERALTAGGRTAARFLGGKAEIGATFIHEETPGAAPINADLAGGDLTVDLTDADNVRLEYAATLRDGPSGGNAEAILAELTHKGERLTASAYYNRTEVGFGLSQQNSAVAGVLRYGAEASLKLDEFESKDGAKRGARFIDAKTYREENLQTGASRTLAEVALRQESNSTSGSVGVRRVEETPQTGPRRRGVFLTADARQRFENLGLAIRASRDQPISGDDASALFPTRTTFGFDQQLFKRVTLSATHEVLDGDAVSQSNTIVGVTAEPWAGGKITAAADRITQDSGERIGATFGVDQQVRLSDKWSASLGVSRREDLKATGVVDAEDDIVPDAAKSPFEEAGGAFTSVYSGIGYRGPAMTGSTRFEMKKSDIGQRYTFVAGAARELSEQLSFAAAGRYQQENNDLTPDTRSFDARIGAAWRPHDDGVIIFNRLDLKQDQIDFESASWKAVHNLAVNAMAADRVQVSLNHGLKYAEFSADGAKYSGITQLAGLEARYDLTPRIDLSLHGEALYSYNSRTLDYAYGPAIGFTPADNIWLSFGWNFSGFVDDDFVGAEYSRSGPYLKVRIKFDQFTARGLLDAISPERTP